MILWFTYNKKSHRSHPDSHPIHHSAWTFPHTGL